jgi:hypothetical protein
MCNFLDYKEYKIVYKRYASLYFITIVDKDHNELIVLELMQTFVEILDKYFGNVCELDLIFNFHKVLPPLRRPTSYSTNSSSPATCPRAPKVWSTRSCRSRRISSRRRRRRTRKSDLFLFVIHPPSTTLTYSSLAHIFS